MDVANKVVIITGASEGIGQATARLLAASGAHVALAARSQDKLRELAQELPNSLVVPTDMRDEKAVRALVARVHEHYGRVDILINNAGQALHVPLEKLDLDDYRAVWELNVIGVIVAMQAVIPIMRAQGGGLILNISSGTSKMFIPGLSPYASTKYALNCLTLTARTELEPDHIRVGIVYPGVTSTRFHDNAKAYDRSRPRRTVMNAETPEQVAYKILEAITTEAAETFTDNIAQR